MDQPESASHGLLLVVGDRAVQRHVYDTRRCAYWSAQFGMVLEKNGLLDYAVAGQDILQRAANLTPYAMVIVGWLPEAFWRDDYIDTLKAYEGVLIFEGAPPAALEEMFGLRPAAGPSSLAGAIEIYEPALSRFMSQHYRAYLAQDRIAIAPKNIQTRPIRPNRWDNDMGVASLGFAELARRVVRSFRIPMWNRLLRASHPPLVREELLSLYFLAWDRAKGGDAPADALPLLTARLAARAGEIVLPLDRAIADEVRRLLGVDCGGALAGPRPARSLWQRAIMFVRGQRSRSRGLSGAAEDVLELLIGLPLAGPRGDLRADDAARLRAHIDGELMLSAGQVRPRHPLNLAELALCAVILHALGQPADAERVLRLCLEAGFDYETGRFTNARVGPEGVETLSHHASSPMLALAFLAGLADTSEAAFVGLEFAERYGADRIERWQAPPYRLRPHTSQGSETVARFHSGVAGPAVVRNGKRVCFAFEALSYIVYYHTMHPLDGPFTDCDASGAMALEALFVALLHQQSHRHDAGLVRVEPWPWGADYCLTLRHDVDRIPDEATLDALIDAEEQAGLGVSWFWLPNRLRADYIARQEALGHEIALHALKHGGKDAEIAAVAGGLQRQPSIYGEFVHGGGGGEYWLGYPSVEAARQAGFEYAEGMSTYYDFPYRFPFLSADGEVGVEDIVAMSHTISIDGAAPAGAGEARPWNSDRVTAAVCNGFYLMALNHPDKHLDRLQQLLSDLPVHGRVDWTCHQVARWWRATHSRDRIRVAREACPDGGRAYSLRAQEDVADVALRLVGVDAGQVLVGDGTHTRFVEAQTTPGVYGGTDTLVRLSLAAGRSVRLELGAGAVGEKIGAATG